MPLATTVLVEELDERGFAVIRGFATTAQVEEWTAVVDEVTAHAAAARLEDNHERVAAGERGIGTNDSIFNVISNRTEVAALLRDERLLRLGEAVKGRGSTLRKVGAIVALPGHGHEGLHQDHDGVDATLGSWDKLVFVVMLSHVRVGGGALRAVPGSHRSAEQPFPDAGGSAYAPHDDEVHIEGEAGDLLIYSGHLWKSGTFNGGREVTKALLVAGANDVGWGG